MRGLTSKINYWSGRRRWLLATGVESLMLRGRESEFTWPAAARPTYHAGVQRIITSSRKLHLSQLRRRLRDDGLTLFKWETNKSAALLSSQKKKRKKKSHAEHMWERWVCLEMLWRAWSSGRISDGLAKASTSTSRGPQSGSRLVPWLGSVSRCCRG